MCIRDSFHADLTKAATVSGLWLPTHGPYESILEEFPDLLLQSFKEAVKHKVQHYITTTGPPIHDKPRRLDVEKLRVAKAEFANMEDLGIVRDPIPLGHHHCTWSPRRTAGGGRAATTGG